MFLNPEESQDSQALCCASTATLYTSVVEKEKSSATEESEREKATRGSSDHPECLAGVQH